MERYNPYAARHVDAVGQTADNHYVWKVLVENQPHVIHYLQMHGYVYGEYLCKDGQRRKGWSRIGV